MENYFERPRGMVLVARLIGRVRIRNGKTVVSSARFSAVTDSEWMLILPCDAGRHQ